VDDLGPLELTEPSREYFASVAPAFERAKERRAEVAVGLASVSAGYVST
jgi:hypothetical protein